MNNKTTSDKIAQGVCSILSLDPLDITRANFSNEIFGISRGYGGIAPYVAVSL
jgi:hypothetical protein